MCNIYFTSFTHQHLQRNHVDKGSIVWLLVSSEAVTIEMCWYKDKLEDMDVSLEKVAAWSGPTLSNLNNSKMAHSFYGIFQDTKMTKMMWNSLN